MQNNISIVARVLTCYGVVHIPALHLFTYEKATEVVANNSRQVLEGGG